jgi:hypothetical protein
MNELERSGRGVGERDEVMESATVCDRDVLRVAANFF